MDAALRSQGVTRLTDTKGGAEAGAVYWQQSNPDSVLDYLLALGARKRASDVQPRAAAGARGGALPDRRLRLPRGPGPEVLRGVAGAGALRDVRPRPGAARAAADGPHDGPAGGGRLRPRRSRRCRARQGVGATIKLVNRVDLHQGLRDPRPRARGPRPPGGGDPLRPRPHPGHLPGLQRRGHDVVRDHELPRPGPARRALDRVARPLDDGRRAAGRGGGGPAGAEDRGDAAGDGGGPARRAHAVRGARLRHGGGGDAARLQPARGGRRPRRRAPPAASWPCGSSACRPQLLASSLGLVLGQRLVRTICRICQVPAEAPSAQTLAAHGIDREEAQALSFFKGKGCPTCNTIGYRGRRAVFEAIPASPRCASALERGRSAKEIEAAAVESGMITIRERALALVRDGRHDLRRVRAAAALRRSSMERRTLTPGARGRDATPCAGSTPRSRVPAWAAGGPVRLGHADRGRALRRLPAGGGARRACAPSPAGAACGSRGRSASG